MSTFKPVHVRGHYYFITAKISGSRKIFADDKYAKIILGGWQWLRQKKRIRLYAFVIMPDHVHFMIEPLGNYTINEICHTFSSFTAHKILLTLRGDTGQKRIMQFFQNKAKDLKDRRHKIWQDLMAKNIYSQKVLEQKINYIHNNPVAKDRHLAGMRYDYKYSSSCFYDLGSMPMINIDDIRDFLT